MARPQPRSLGNPSLDAFARLRTSDPFTIFDSKQLWSSEPLVWDDQETAGTGTTSSHSPDRASTTIGVTASTTGTRVRQTFRHFNYQSGKSQMFVGTAVFKDEGAGVTKRLGLFTAGNGFFFEMKDGVMGVVIRSSTSGEAVDTRVPQTDWNIDKMNDESTDGVTVDWDKAQIFVIDYEWLGVGRIRFGLFIHGLLHYVHEVRNANANASAYMSTGNHPVRFEISNDGSGGAATLEQICATVISEGGQQPSGRQQLLSTEGVHLTAQTADVVYAAIGVRLKASHLDATVDVQTVNVIAESVAEYEWQLRLNPTVNSTFSYSDVTNSALQVAKGVTANTVSGGHVMTGGWGSGAASMAEAIHSVLKLGSAIDGTTDEMVLCVRPLTAAQKIQSSLVMYEEI